MDEVIEDNIYEEPSKKKPFRHIVISGGHVWGLNALGLIHRCIEEKVLDICHIESIHGTSIGALIGIILALNPDINDIVDYFLNRPWNILINKYDTSPLVLYNTNGVFNKELIVDVMSPILKSNDIPVNISLEDFYKVTGKDLYIYVTELNSYKTESFSHKTHPEWELLDVLYASCCLPIIFAPLVKGDKCYVDGGFLLNYPLDKCIDNISDLDSVFGISLGHTKENSISSITADTHIVDYVSILIMKIYENVLFPHSKYSVPYEVKMYSRSISAEYILKIINSHEERRNLYDYGYEYMSKLFVEDNLWINRRMNSI
jgi:NTE family protein